MANDEALSISLRHELPVHVRPYAPFVTGYELRSQPPGLHAGLPSRHLTVVISLDQPVDMIAMPDPAQPPAAMGALAGGMHAAPVAIRHAGTQVGMHLCVTPLGARTMFGMPAAELAWQVVPLDAVFAGTAELVERLHTAATWTLRFGVLTAALSRSIAAAHRTQVRPELLYAYERLVASGGRIDIQSLSGEIGWSRRHLACEFSKEFGLAPKLTARVLRFERAAAMVASGRCPSLALVAAMCGYADQAHMTRDWVQFSSMPPAEWLAVEGFHDVQVTAALAGCPSQHDSSRS